jgi:hypothetical protein
MKDLSVTPPPPPVVKEEEKKPVAVVNSTPKTEEKVVNDDKDRPFTAEYFDVKDWGKLLLEPKLDISGLVQKLTFVEEYLSTQLKANSMNADRSGMKDILEDIEKSLNIDHKHDVSYRIARVYGFLNVIKAAKEKEDIRRQRLVSLLKK